MKDFITLTEYDGYHLNGPKIRIRISEISHYQNRSSIQGSYLTMKDGSTYTVLESADSIDRLIVKDEEMK